MAPDRYPLTPPAQEFTHHRLIDLVQQHLESAGHADPWSLRGAALAPFALYTNTEGWTRQVQGATTTSDFAGLLDDVVRQVYLDAYAAAPSTFAPWTRSVTLADFQTAYAIAPGFPALLPVGEHGEITRGGPPQAPGEPIRLRSFARILGLTREMVLNSDLVSFAALVDALGVSAAAMESDVVYGILTSNPPLADGQALFSPAHHNTMPAAALTAASLGAACAALAAQTAASGAPLHLVGRYLLTSVADGPVARELAVKQTPPGAGAEAGVLQVLVDDRIPTGQWYVLADPTAQRALMVTAHLDAEPTPVLDARDHWAIGAREYRGRNDFGAAVLDYRAAVLTPAS